MIRDQDAPLPGPHPLVRVLGPEDPFLAGALAVPHLAFAAPGTAVGEAGAEALAAEITARAGRFPPPPTVSGRAAAFLPRRSGRASRSAPGCTSPSAA